jgi:hypothetical protein
MESWEYVHVEKLNVDGKAVMTYFKVFFLHLHRDTQEDNWNIFTEGILYAVCCSLVNW